ncbi:MAG TPA: hypothetical protein DDY16_02325 [Tenacibaculum sp.]|nr:hypothetical protein [Tenacibaculum sp.]
MKNYKLYFLIDKQFRNGAFVLTLLIVILQFVYFYFDFSKPDTKIYNKEDASILIYKTDSLKELSSTRSMEKRHKFNPNYMSDHKGYLLGMSVEEIDKFFDYRKKNQFVKSARDFQFVTGISDSLLKVISPYFRFPKWMNNKRESKNKGSNLNDFNSFKNDAVNTGLKDINNVSRSELTEFLGGNEILANRIVKYRAKLKGYTYDSQLQEVWGLSDNEFNLIQKFYKVLDKTQIKKVNVNTASFKEILSLPYIDYNLCKKIFDYKEEFAEIQKIEELKNITNFPIKKYDRIVLYLSVE